MHGLARDLDGSLVAVEQAADHVEQCRFAATGRTDHRQELARHHVERDVVDGGEHAVGRLEPLDDVFDHQNRGGRRGARRPGINSLRRHG